MSILDAGTVGPEADIATKLATLSGLHDRGALSDAEFADAKQQLLQGARFIPPASRRRWAVAMALLLTTVAVGAVIVVAYLVALGFGPLAGAIAALAADVAVLSFLTLRAYPPDAKRPMVRLALGAIIFLPIPVAYLAWLWITRKKWNASIGTGP